MGRSIRFVAKIVLTILFIILLLYFVKPIEIYEAFHNANYFWIVFALLLLPINFFIQCVRWHYLVKQEVDNVRWIKILQSVLYSYFYGIFTPARLGELGRAFHIDDNKRKELIILAMQEKIYAFGTIILLGSLALTIYKSYYYLILTVLLSTILIEGRIILKRTPVINKFYHILCKVSTIRIILISLLFSLTYFLQFFLVIHSFKVVEFLPTMFYISLIMFFNSIPITLSGLGTRELLSIFFLKNIGISRGDAASASLLLFTINILVPTIIGFFMLILKRDKHNHSVAKT